MLGALGLLLSSVIRQLENFAGVMNFVIFPMFFASSALYPLWRVREVELAALADLPVVIPFTHAVELIRFALYAQVDLEALAVVVGCHRRLPRGAALIAYGPSRAYRAARRAGRGRIAVVRSGRWAGLLCSMLLAALAATGPARPKMMRWKLMRLRSILSSCADLVRASTWFHMAHCLRRGVDGRDKPGQDDVS